MPAIAEARPPFVTFEYQPEEDRKATMEKGHYVSKDVAYAIVTPQGSKDRIPRRVDDWFAQLEQQVLEERFPAEWLQRFKAKFEAWEKGNSVPEFGTSVRNWPAASPAQVQTLIAAHVMTVEDLAAANEEVLMRLGMGGRALKQQALAWLDSSSATGKTAAELADLRVRNEELTAANEKLMAQLTTLAAKVEALAPSKPTPPSDVK